MSHNAKTNENRDNPPFVLVFCTIFSLPCSLDQHLSRLLQVWKDAQEIWGEFERETLQTWEKNMWKEVGETEQSFVDNRTQVLVDGSNITLQ